jgi:hypothetical protein
MEAAAFSVGQIMLALMSKKLRSLVIATLRLA